MSWRDKAAAWLGKFMHVPDYATFDEALRAQGVEPVENPLGVSDSISLKLTKGDPNADTGNPGDSSVEGVPAEPESGTACAWNPEAPDGM